MKTQEFFLSINPWDGSINTHTFVSLLKLKGFLSIIFYPDSSTVLKLNSQVVKTRQRSLKNRLDHVENTARPALNAVSLKSAFRTNVKGRGEAALSYKI